MIMVVKPRITGSRAQAVRAREKQGGPGTGDAPALGTLERNQQLPVASVWKHSDCFGNKWSESEWKQKKDTLVKESAADCVYNQSDCFGCKYQLLVHNWAKKLCSPSGTGIKKMFPCPSYPNLHSKFANLLLILLWLASGPPCDQQMARAAITSCLMPKTGSPP